MHLKRVIGSDRIVSFSSSLGYVARIHVCFPLNLKRCCSDSKPPSVFIGHGSSRRVDTRSLNGVGDGLDRYGLLRYPSTIFNTTQSISQLYLSLI